MVIFFGSTAAEVEICMMRISMPLHLVYDKGVRKGTLVKGLRARREMWKKFLYQNRDIYQTVWTENNSNDNHRTDCTLVLRLIRSSGDKVWEFKKSKMAELCLIEFNLTNGHISLARAYRFDVSIGDRRTAFFGGWFGGVDRQRRATSASRGWERQIMSSPVNVHNEKERACSWILVRLR